MATGVSKAACLTYLSDLDYGLSYGHLAGLTEFFRRLEDVRALIVGNEAGEILLVQRADSGVWLYPTGWADVGYSPAEVAVNSRLVRSLSTRITSSTWS